MVAGPSAPSTEPHIRYRSMHTLHLATAPQILPKQHHPMKNQALQAAGRCSPLLQSGLDQPHSLHRSRKVDASPAAVPLENPTPPNRPPTNISAGFCAAAEAPALADLVLGM